MSNTRDNTPEMDYYELRRQREEYKQRMRMRMEQSAPAQSAATPAQEPIEEPRSAQPQPEFIPAQQEDPAARDAFEAAIEEGYENYDADDEDMDALEEMDDGANPNPFDSFIHFFHGVKNSISARRGRDEEADDPYADEYPEEDWDGEEAPARPMRPAASPEEEDGAEADASNALDIEDPLPRRRSERVETDFEDEDPAFIDDDFEDDPEDELPRSGGLKKFMNLFIERVDDENDGEDDEDFDEFEDGFDAPDASDAEDFDFDDADGEEMEEAPRRRGLFGRLNRKNRREEADDAEEEDEDFIMSERDDADFMPVLREEAPRKPEGGYTMEENKTPTPVQPQTAPASEGIGMTRRERRELAMRLAAEEAARKAAEEAARRAEEEKAMAEKPVAIEPLFADAQPADEKVDMGVFENAPKTDILVETTAEEAPVADEPTRKFTPVSLRDVQEAENSNLFSIDEEDYEDEDDEDEEDEIIEKKPRRGLFGRKKSRAYDDEDEEDEDEEDEEDDDEDDDEDEEDEVIEKKPRRGLFGRKKSRAYDDEDEDDYDEDEDEEDDEEYDDADEDDEYDEYDDDEDEDEDEDEYDDEDDAPRRSFGHHLIGIFKVILGVILVLLVIVIALNFFSASTVSKLHDLMGDSSAFQLLFPSYSIRSTLDVKESDAEDPALTDLVAAEPTALPEPEATVFIPNLDGTTADGEDADIITEPVVEAAPVTEASIG